MAQHKVDVYMPLYVRDFLTSTIGWSAEERGHYLVLLMLAWDRGHLPADLDQLERLSPGVSAVWPILEDKFPVGDDGLRRNARLEKHREKCVELKEKRVEAAKRAAAAKAAAASARASGQQTQGNRDANVEQSLTIRGAIVNHPTSTPTSTPTSLREEEELQQHTTTRQTPSCSEGPERQEPWSPDPSHEWERLREAWNATPGVERFDGFQFPRGDLVAARCSDPDWIRMYPDALARLPSCRFFNRPVSLRQFLGETFVADVLCGTFDHAKNGRVAAASRQPRKGGL